MQQQINELNKKKAEVNLSNSQLTVDPQSNKDCFWFLKFWIAFYFFFFNNFSITIWSILQFQQIFTDFYQTPQ